MFHENQTAESVSRLVKTLKLNQHRLDNRLGVPPNSIQEFSGEQTLLNGAPTSNEQKMSHRTRECTWQQSERTDYT